MQLSMGFPTNNEELDIMERFIVNNPIDTLEPVCTKEQILEAFQEEEELPPGYRPGEIVL